MEALELEKIYGTSDEEQIIKLKTVDKQVKAISFKPKLVEIDSKTCKSMCDKIGLEYLSGYENRILQYKISDESCDRYGDIVRYSGADIKDYMNNPVVLFAHNYQDFPIGNSLKVWKDNASKCLWSWAICFDDRVDSTGRSDIAFKFASSGAMPGCSIGFMPIESRSPSSDEERKSIGLGKYGVEHVKWSMLEFSACSVPANPNALLNCIGTKSLFTNSNIKRIVDDRDFFSQFISDDIAEKIKECYKSSSSIIVQNDINELSNSDNIDDIIQKSIIETRAAVDSVALEIKELKKKLDSIVDLVTEMSKCIEPKKADKSTHCGSDITSFYREILLNNK